MTTIETAASDKPQLWVVVEEEVGPAEKSLVLGTDLDGAPSVELDDWDLKAIPTVTTWRKPNRGELEKALKEVTSDLAFQERTLGHIEDPQERKTRLGFLKGMLGVAGFTVLASFGFLAKDMPPEQAVSVEGSVAAIALGATSLATVRAASKYWLDIVPSSIREYYEAEMAREQALRAAIEARLNTIDDVDSKAQDIVDEMAFDGSEPLDKAVVAAFVEEAMHAWGIDMDAIHPTATLKNDLEITELLDFIELALALEHRLEIAIDAQALAHAKTIADVIRIVTRNVDSHVTLTEA